MQHFLRMSKKSCTFAACMKKYKAIFIDWDDTIGDWKGAESDALHEMFEKHHLSEFYPSPDEFIAVYEDFNRTMWELYGLGKVTKEYLARERFVHPLVYPLGIDHEKAPQPFISLADKMAEEFLALTSKYFRPLPGTVEVVHEVAKHYPLTLISNGFKEVQYYKIEHSGLKDCFKHVLISEEVGINKPLPGIYEEGLRRNGLQAEEVVMVGDSYFSDISGAKAAGIDQIWITDNPGEETATYIVPKLADILTIV